MPDIIPIPAVSSQLATGVHIKKIFGYTLQSIIFIFKRFSTASDLANINEVTLFIDNTAQIEMERSFLFDRNPVRSNPRFTIDGNISVFLGVVEEDIQSAF